MKKYIAELIGTFVLVLVGVGSAVIAGGDVGNLGVAFAFGLAVLTMAYAIGPISGCHINPAVSIGMFVAKKLSGKDTMWYIAAQSAGAVIGAGVLLLIARGMPEYSIVADGLGQNGYGALSPGGYDVTAAFLTEMIFTALFIFVILGATAKMAHDKFAGIAIGLALVMIHIVTIPVTNTSVNPARSLGPALFAGGEAISQLWLFIVAPLLGAVIAAFVWQKLFAAKKD